MPEPRRYAYKPNLGAMLGAIALFGVAAVFFTYRALQNDRGLVINGIIHLGPHAADVFFAVLAALSVGFVAMGVLGAVRFLGTPRWVVLHDDAIELPPTVIRRAVRRVPYASVVAIELWNVSGQPSVRIVHAGGAEGVARSMVGQTAFDEIVAELRRRCAPR